MLSLASPTGPSPFFSFFFFFICSVPPISSVFSVAICASITHSSFTHFRKTKELLTLFYPTHPLWRWQSFNQNPLINPKNFTFWHSPLVCVCVCVCVCVTVLIISWLSVSLFHLFHMNLPSEHCLTHTHTHTHTQHKYPCEDFMICLWGSDDAAGLVPGHTCWHHANTPPRPRWCLLCLPVVKTWQHFLETWTQISFSPETCLCSWSSFKFRFCTWCWCLTSLWRGVIKIKILHSMISGQWIRISEYF